MASVPVGPNGSFTLVVTAEHLANRFKDATLPPVLATPVMIMAMENAALNAIKPFLKERGKCGGVQLLITGCSKPRQSCASFRREP